MYLLTYKSGGTENLGPFTMINNSLTSKEGKSKYQKPNIDVEKSRLKKRNKFLEEENKKLYDQIKALKKALKEKLGPEDALQSDFIHKLT